MVVNNIKDLLLKSLNKLSKQDTVIKSIIWNHIIAEYKEKKWIDITPYIISIQLKNNICIIHTQKPILNADLSIYENDIKEKINKSFADTGIVFKNLEFRYK